MQTLLDKCERKRLKKLSVHESRLRKIGYKLIAGVDEAGRGPLAGPVVAAACILPEPIALINDSKQLSAQEREELYQKILSAPGVFFGMGIVSHTRIDEINILQATLEAMQLAIQQLQQMPDYLLIDGNRLPKCPCPAEALIQGDALSYSIAAASILAKVTRDRMMDEEGKKWPQYGFEQHKGYGTPQHLEAIRLHGPCSLHRKSFEPIKGLSKNN